MLCKVFPTFVPFLWFCTALATCPAVCAMLDAAFVTAPALSIMLVTLESTPKSFITPDMTLSSLPALPNMSPITSDLSPNPSASLSSWI